MKTYRSIFISDVHLGNIVLESLELLNIILVKIVVDLRRWDILVWLNI